MKEHPILFSTEMVMAILEGHKTQTRRVVKFPKFCGLPDGDFDWIKSVLQDGSGKGWIAWSCDRLGLEDFTKKAYPDYQGFPCPYGQPGDRLWVRETWQLLMPCTVSFGPGEDDWDWESEEADAIYSSKPEIGTLCYKTDDPNSCNWWRPSIHMPRWASRITLEIVNVMVERVRDISNADAQAEGVGWWQPVGGEKDYRLEFAMLWDRINAKRGYGWDSNPWVWVIEFRVIKGKGEQH